MKAINRVNCWLSAGDHAKQQTASQHIFTAVSKLEAGLTERQTHGLRSRYSPQITIRRFIFEYTQTYPLLSSIREPPIHRNHDLVALKFRFAKRNPYNRLERFDRLVTKIAHRKREKKKEEEKGKSGVSPK